ncbi:mechanosensitive ion channel family protein [Microvirga yunnanensis]|uniref:mechanosensitive ion channel family protein n=1 Tax=Microvirga yunnanensis TaxID=2953740 RepID=UPI0021C75384|nr:MULTISPECIES: mechanosensitive ion channel family protein [unclassified Microvirga]
MSAGAGSVRRLKAILVIAIAIVCLGLGGTGSPSRPSGMVAEEPTSAPAPAAGATNGSPLVGPSAHGPERHALPSGVASAVQFLSRAGAMVRALPDFGWMLARIPDEVAHSSPERPPGRYWLLLGVAVVASLLAEGATRHGVRWLSRDSTGVPPEVVPMGTLAADAALDALAWAVLAVVAYAAIARWFAGGDFQNRLGVTVMEILLWWRLIVAVLMVLFRPARAHLRIARINDQDARSLFRTFQVAALGIVALPFLTRQFTELQPDPEVVSAARLVHGLVVWLLLEGCFIAAHAPLTRWFTSNVASTGESPIGSLLIRHWAVLSQAFLILVIGAQVYSAVTVDPAAGRTVYKTLVFGLLLVLLETVLAFAMRRAKARAEQSPTLPLKRAMVVRSVRVAAIVLAAMVVCQSWAVDVLGLVDEARWQSSVKATTRSGITLFVAYVAYEMIEYYAAKFRMDVSPGIDPASGAGSLAYSRVSTLVPVLRIVALVFVVGVPIFVVLTEAGVNVAPLLAGASIFGLAVSFGSQALVKDIVSGIFYLADDAFRIGESIECQAAQGTVEGFTIRSLRVRSRNGNLHVVPYGELGAITNTSRGLKTIDIDLKFGADTDLERVKSIVRDIARSIEEDPACRENGDTRLTLHGISDIAGGAIVFRLSLSARPGHADALRREILTRLYTQFQESGVKLM